MVDDPKRPLKVFLCHTHADRDAVRELYQRLKGEGWIDPWLDVARILPGHHWTSVIRQALADADSVIIFISNSSINREGFVQREMNHAWDLSLEKPRSVIYLIPLRLEDCEVPFDLRERQWADYFGERKGETYRALLQSLKLRHEQKLRIEAEEQARQEKQKRKHEVDEKVEQEAAEKGRLVSEKLARQKNAREKAKRDATENPVPQPKEHKPVITQNLPRKWSTQIITAIVAIVVIFAAVFGLPWSQWFATTPAILTATPSSTVTFTHTPPTSTLTSTITLLPTEITDANGVTMRLVAASEFTMGSNNGKDDEKPVHQVYLDNFYMDKYEVTNALYRACEEAKGCTTPKQTSSYTHSDYYGNSEFDNYPVIYVDWNQAKTYCEWRNASLPTEAQWEKAARGRSTGAGDRRTYPWGYDAPNKDLLNYNQNVGDTTPVGSYKSGKSPYGIYDLAGNVWEWTADWYSETYYQESPFKNPLGPDSSSYRVLRGGSLSDPGDYVRFAIRDYVTPVNISNYVGFRCARNAKP